jgi:hypothetical protein
MTRKAVGLIVAAFAVMAAFAGFAVGNDGRQDDKTFQYTIGLWGDLPYNDAQATTGVPNLIADMNASKLVFTVHDGDLKAGNGITGSTTPTKCTDALYVQGLGYLNMLDGAAMFTPGDNDWTDCDRAKNGSFNSLERLDHERQVFFSGQYATSSVGTKPMQQEVQGAQAGELQCKGVDTLDTSKTPPVVAQYKNVPCVENRRWTYGGVTYATFDMQGSCNNLCDTNPDPTEEQAHVAADIQWLDQTFAEAKANGSAGVMLISQADPGFDNSDATRAPTRNPVTLAENDNLPASDPAAPGPAPDGFQSWLVEVRKDTIDFGGPVVYVHGDCTTSESTNRWQTRTATPAIHQPASGSRTSPASRRSATTSNPGSTTSNGSRSWSTRQAVTCLPSSRR